VRGKKTDFYDAEKLERMAHRAREYEPNPLKELATLYAFLKDVEVRYRNRLGRATGSPCDHSKKMIDLPFSMSSKSSSETLIMWRS
jgi:transposase